MADRTSELYEIVSKKGLLADGMTEDMFREQTKTDEGLRSFYDYAKEHGMRVSDWDTFRDKTRGVITAAPTDNRETTERQPAQQAGVSGGSLLNEQEELARQNAILGVTNDPNQPFVGQEPQRVTIPRQANLVQEAVNKMATTPTPHMEVDENGLPQYTTTPLPIPTQASIDADRREQKSWFTNFKEDIGRNWGTKEGLKQLARTIPSKFAASTVSFMNGLFAGAQQLSAGTMVGSQFGGVYQVPTLDEQYAAYRRVQNGSKDPKDMENSSAVRLIEQGKAIQERLSEKGNPIDLAEDEDFVSLARQGKISSFMRYGLGTAVESGMDNLMALTPLGRVALASSIAGNRFHEKSIENMDDVPLWARAVSAVGEGAIAQFVESRYNPFHVLDGLGKGGVKGVLHDIEEQAGKNMYKWIAKQLGKATVEEGGEEITENVLDDILNNMLALDKDAKGLGWQAEYEKYRVQHKNLSDDEAMRAFAGEKAHQYLNDFIGGALGGLFMGGGRMAMGGRSIAQTAKDYSDLGTAMQDVADEMGVTIQDIAQVYDEQATMTPEQIEGRPDFRELNERLREAMIRRQQGIVNSPEEQQEAEVQQDRQTQLRQQATVAAQQEVQGMAHQDGNIYYVGIKGNEDAEGYAVSGNINMQQDQQGMYSTSGRDLITVKMNDGSVQQVPADELIVRDLPVSADELMQERTEHYFAQYANNDLFHVGDKVYIKQNGQQSAESSTITAIDDAGIHVEAYDEQTGQTGEIVISHEQAAEKLALAQDEQPAQGQVVDFTIDGNPLQLYQVGEDTYEERTPDGKTYRYTSADLANMGAIRQTEALGTSQIEALGTSQIEGSGSSQIEEQAPAYPTDETGNPAWGHMEVPQSAQVLYDLYKGNRESAKAYADDQLKEAQRVQKSAAKLASHNLNLAQRLAEEEQNAQFKAQADAAVKYWEDVKLAIAQIKTAEELAVEQAQRDKLMAAREQNRKTEEGTTANATMAERYNAAPKIIGNAGTTTLPDGRELSGHYVLISPEGVTASHNAADNFRRSEGYPITADGQSINDRDYTADQEEQQKVTSIAQNFNGNAIKNMPVISDEGLVYNGNGRMMAGQLAAINGTDAAYTQSLMNNAAQYGFTPEQVASIPNARVVFQLDERLPYSTQSLAIFNEQETQTQSNTGKAAGYARKLTPQAVSDVLSSVDGFNTIDAFFSDKKAPFNLINSLINAGIIAQREKAEMIDGDKLSATGRERLANILFGTVFDNETIRLMGDDAALKNSIMRALPQILDNKSLGEFSLESDINDAIRLLYEVRRAGVPFQSFVRQTVMSEDGEVHTAAENYSPYQLLLAEEMIDGGVDAFRNVLNLYNEQANTIQGGQVDIFGDLLDPTELKNLILQRYGKEPNETERPSTGRQNDNAPASAPASNEPAAEVTNYPQLIFAKNYYKDKGAREVAHGIKEDDLDSIFEAADEMYEALKPYVNDMVNGGGITFIPVPSRKGKADTTFKLASLVSQRITNKTPKWRDGTVTFENILQGNERESLYELKKAGKNIPDGDFFGYRLTGELPQKGTIILVDGVYATGVTMDAARKAVGGDAISLVYAYDDTKAAEVTPEERLAKAEAETDTNPTEAQKKAENYKQGHVTLWGLPITIENPKGSIRRGTDANGKQWEQEMHHTYGKIRRTEGVDGDHIDVFIGPNLYSDKVFVVDQRNVDTGEFDEHKCMLGFDSLEDAQNGYLSNYEEGWQGMGTVTEVTMDEFKKWIDSSRRKTKPFAEYKSVKAEGAASTAMDSGEQLRDELAVELRKLDKKYGKGLPKDFENMVSNANFITELANKKPKAQTKEEGLTPLETAKETEPKNTIFTDDAYEKAKARMKARLNRLNMGIDPEMVADQIVIAGYHVERGARKFADFARALIADFGDGIRQYARQMYNYLRDIPEGEPFRAEMDDYTTVMAFDIDNFDFKDRMMPAVREYEDVNGQKIVIDDVVKGRDGTVYYDLSVTEPSGHARQTSLPVDNFNKELESKGIFPANSEKNERKNAENEQNILINQNNLVTLQPNEKEYAADGLSVVVNTQDYTTYLTPQAKEVFARLGQKERKAHKRPELSYISFASRDGVMIPLDVLKSDPAIVDAQAKIDSNIGSLELTQEQIEEYANRLLEGGDIKSERKAFIIIGRPAGGKSSVFAEPLAEQNSARIIDSDEVKPWLDGYDNGDGAGYVQKASDLVMQEALWRAVLNGDNVVIPKIGGGSIIDEITLPLKELGYTVELYYNEVAPESSYMRAMARFAEKGRYLSLNYLAGIGDKPTKTFNNYSTKDIYGTISELSSQKVQDLRARLTRIREMETQLLPERLGQGGRSISTLGISELLESGELGRGRDSQLTGTPLFDHYEWKNNDVPFGTKPKTIKQGDNVNSNNDNGNAERTVPETSATETAPTGTNQEGAQDAGEASGLGGNRPADRSGLPSPQSSQFEQEAELERQAKANGTWLDFEEIYKSAARALPVGKEADVYLSQDGKHVIKVVNYSKYSQTPYDFLRDRVELFNLLFPETAYRLLGYTRNADGQFCPVVEQPFIEGHLLEDYWLATKGKVKYSELEPILERYMLEKYGMHKYGLDAYEDELYRVQDLHLKNVRIDDDGNLYVIDAVPSYRPTNDGGGKKTTYEKGQKVKYKNKVDGKLYDATIDSVNADGTYNLLAPNPVFGDVFMGNISEDRISPIEQQKEEKPVSPMMKQFQSIKEQYPDATLMFRVGDFYELYEEDAVEASKILGINLVKRKDGHTFAGFPFHALDTYLPKLVRAGKRVAICDQLEDPKKTTKTVKRGVSELVTPGTPYQEPAPETQLEPQQVVTDTVGEITESKHTKTGNPIWIVKPLERVSDDEFRALRKRAKENNGYYSTFVKGYVFNSVNDATRFNNISDVQTTTEQGRADSEAAISTAETASAEAAAIRRDSGDTSGAAGELGGESVETGVSGSRDVELTPEQAAEQTQERKDAIQKIDEATERIDKQLAELTDQAEEETPEEEPAPTSMSEVVEQAKKRQQKAKQRKQKLEQTLDLFADAEDSTPAIAEQTEPINNKDNGSTEVRNDGERESSAPQGRTAGQPADQNGTLGGSQRQANEGTQSGRVGSRSEQHRVHDGERGLGTAGQRSTESVEEPVAESERKNTHNFRYDPSDPAPTSNKARYEANLAAIRLLKQLQDEGIQATPEEQRILAKFTGWGGLGEFFKGEPGTTYYVQNGEKSPYQVIKELLTDEEMQAAQLSRNSAYFTPPAIIDELWSIAQHLGFKGGNILEGSAGVGNILSQMPQSISDRSNLQAVEIDSITAGILAQLYPDAQVHAAGFQEVDIPNNSQDLVITNVPFVTGLRVYDKKEKDLSKRFRNIHDFCIAKNIRKLRQGGIGIFITSSGTLDSSKDLRRWLNNEGETDVIGAFRLNRETFGGTSATSDIIVVRKRVNGQKAPNPIDVLDTETARTAYYEEDGKEVGRKLIYNRYFVEHPLSMGGEMGFGFEHGDTRWGGTTAGCYPVAAINQSQRLREWVNTLDNSVHIPTYQELEQGATVTSGTYEEYEGAVPYGSLILNSKGEICKAYHGQAIPVEGITPTKVKGHTKAEVLTDYNAIKKAVEDLLWVQSHLVDMKNGQPHPVNDEELKPYLRKLNKAYDDFVKKYGYLNRNVSLSFLRNDVQWASMAALENVRETIDKSGKKKIEVSKTDVFFKRVVGVTAEPKAENARDGVILSVQQYGNVRPDMIAMWLERPQEEVEKEIIESRLAFRDPQTGNMVVSHEYLSGNVREKLAYAEEHNENGIYNTNIEELRKVIPVDIPAHLIEFNIGSTWIPVELYHQYLKEKFGVDNLQLVHVGSAWISNEKSYGGYALRNEKNRAEGVYSEKLMEQVYGHQLMIAAMNNVPVVVSKVQKNYDGTTETITDKAATAACSDKISQIKDDFVEWARGKIQEDNELAERVQKIYNERFNAIVPMLSVDKAFLSPHLPGQNHKYTLYDHQQQAVVRATTQPVMLAHEVGTGKTITLISSAMEMRRLGTAKKPMIVVQNATTPQFVKEAKDLYPNAKILTVSERDRTKEGRQEFYAKIKYNDWDLIIVPQSVFDMIPDSESRMRDFIQEKIDEKMHAIEAAKEANVDAKVTKRMEKELEALQEDLQNANMSGKRSKSKSTEKDAKKEAERIENAKARAEEMLDRRTDEVEDFDDMGIDALLIDEAHNYKHLGFATMMTRGVKGIDPSYSKRAAALYLKCQSVYERCGHRNVVFATGTPISNTAAEIWTFMKYLMPKEVLKDNDIYYFDDFVHNFGKIAEQLEFATNGKFKANNRFAQYGNVPELMRIWLTCADCVLTREVGQVNDKVPELEGGKAQDIFLPQSPSLIDIMASVRAELERYEQMSGKEKKENSHIPLTMYGVAKRAAIDPRLVDASAADEPLSKTNKAVEETLRSLKETKKYNGTVAIFCDSYRNLQTGFNLFEDIKAKLVKAGVPAAKIAIIRSEMTDAAKQKIFDAVREGEIRVIMGSTQTLGTGVNIQTRLHTLIHMDAPDRPMDYTQRNGRIIRQGNMHRQWNLPVRVLRFGVEDSLDVTSYQRLKTKAGFIDSIMNGKSMIDNNLENRVLEDVEEGIFDNPVAMLSGSQYALLKSQAERDLRKWQARKQQHDIDQILIAKKLKDNAQIIERRRQLITTDEKFLQTLRDTFPTGKVTEYNIDGTICHNATELKEALKATNADIQARADKLRKEGYEGSKQNIAVSLQFNGMLFNVNIVLVYNSRWESGQRAITINKEVQYTTPTSDHWLASPTKVLDKLIEHIEQDYLSGTAATSEINYSRSYIERLQQENELMRQREGKPFEHGAELEKAQALVDEYTEKMQDELAEKEAKYANMSSGRAVTFNEQDDENETTSEAQYDKLNYTPVNMTEAQQLATSAVIEALNDNTDLDVFLATDEEVEAQKKSFLETATWSEHMLRTNYAADISSNDGTKILKNIETTKQKLENSSNLTIKDPVSVLSHAIGLQKTGLSYYGTFKTLNGSTITLRISNHNATVSNFDNEKEQEGISIVITPQRSKGISNDGTAHIIEYYYRKNDFAHYYGRPYAEILGSIKTLLETGEYTDTTGLAIREEVNVPDMMLTPNGTLYGWAIGDKIYLTKDGLNPNTPIHEYTHLWAKAMMRNNREGWQSIVDIFKDTEFWDEVVNDPNYQGLTTDDAICSEVLARYSGQRGAAHMEQWAQEELAEADYKDDLLRGAKVRRLIKHAKQAIEDFWHWVGTNLFGIKHFDSAEQVADRVLYDMLNQTELGDLSGNTNTEMMMSGYTPEKQRIINEWYAAHPYPQYQLGETFDHYTARLDAWKEEFNKLQLKDTRPSINAATKKSNRSISAGTSSFVPGVRPTPLADETPGEYALRLRQYYQLMRDERLVAEYVAEINNQADAAAKVLKKNTIVRGLLDAAKPIENFQEWMKQHGATITDESNAYTDTFLATGRVTEANEKMQRDIIRPLAKQIAKIITPTKETGKSRLDGINIVWHNMDIAGTGTKLDGKALTPREIIGVYCQAKDCAEAIEKGLPDRGAKGFLNNLGMSHDDIITAVESVIPRAELDELWRLINTATHFALNYDYESGRISEDTHTEFYQREFYVPQRGWRERDESGLITDYEPVGKRGNDPYNAALVKAHGRQSLASDPFAYIMSIDASSIVSSENNKIKQKFLQFCLDNEDLGLQTGAFRVKKYWIMNVIDPETGKIKLDEEGNPMMEVSYVAPSAEDLSHDRTIKELIKKKRKEWAKVNQALLVRQSHGELGPQLEAAYKTKLSKIEQAIEDLEQQMHIAWNATNTNITQRTSDEKKQHEVRVLLDGQEYLIEVQDEKLANAINKKFKQHQEQLFNTSQKMRNATRFMSAVLTQYNPEFAVSNFARDFQVALATLTAEHPELVGSFLKNFAACQPAVWQYAFNDKVRDRAVFRDSELGRYLQEYLKAGAATGFSYMQDLKTLRQDFDAMINESNLRRGIKGAVGTLSMLTQVSETAVRFAGYVSARQAGMGVNEAAYLSKELTTNFDRAGEVADSGWMSWFSFFRATLNGNIKFLKALKKMPVAYSIIAAVYVAMGMLNQFLNPDDPEDEVWAGDFTRESNFVIGKWRIPTAHFLRMFFAAGVNAAKWMQEEKSFGEATYNTATFASNELLPDYLNLLGNATEWNSRDGKVDFTWEGLLQGVMPSPVSPIADVYFNRDFRGATINREPFVKSQEGTKDILLSKENTLPVYKWLTQAIYEGVGGNMNAKYQSDDPAWRSWLFDTSASSVEHVVEGYMPAGMDMFITLGEAIYDAATGTPTGPDKWPFVRKFYNAYTPERAYMQQYYLLNGRVKEFKRNMDDYRKNDPQKYRRVQNSQEYRIYQAAERLVKNQVENPTTADVKALINANKQWIKYQ